MLLLLGICLSIYDESGLAYNRFCYYDPQSGCYLKSDPIGLLGGETPYAYVHNPMGWDEPFGLSNCWNAARRKYWKNEAIINPYKHSPKNLARMFKGKAP